MDTFLQPIEKPASLGMKLAYFFTLKKFGKVLTPLKVHSARLPTSFGMWYAKISELDKKLTLSQEMTLLIRQQIAQLNVCEFCMDASRSFVINSSISVEKFDALSNYKHSTLFSEAEKAALDFATNITKTKTSDLSTFKELQKYFSEREICEVVYLIASEPVYNLTNIALNIHSDMLCDMTKMKNHSNL